MNCRKCDGLKFDPKAWYCDGCKVLKHEKRKRILAVQSLLNVAIRRKELKRVPDCEVCDKRKSEEAHHADYNLPLDVIWSCRPCHRDMHRFCEVIY